MTFTGTKRGRGLLVLGVVAIVVGLLASWLWTGRIRSAQQQERSDLNLFLDASSAGWAEATDQFFTVPENAAQIIGALSEAAAASDERIELLTEAIRSSPALDAAFLGYPDGSFVFVARSDEEAPGGFRTRVISIDGPRRDVELTWTDASLAALRSQVDTTDDYDPRQRPWYLDATAGVDEKWTEPYVFASSQQPGITHSRRVLDEAGDQVAVVGIDIRLTELGGFLDLLAPGPNGEALVVDGDGQVIAASSMDAPPVSLEEVEGAISVDNSDALAGSIARLQTTEDMVARERSPDELRTTITRPVRDSQSWYLAVQALDEDFLGDFSTSTAKNLFGTVAVGAATAIIIGALGLLGLRYRQGLKEEAEVDELTGVLSRRAVKRLLALQLRDPRAMVSVAIVDLDNFKTVNDTHGHAVGDRVLAAMAARIQSFAEGNRAFAGRFGGDEFAVVATAGLEWDELCIALGEPISVGDQVFDVGASIGVALSEPGDERGAEELLNEADHALFDVKRSGGGAVRIARAVSAHNH